MRRGPAECPEPADTHAPALGDRRSIGWLRYDIRRFSRPACDASDASDSEYAPEDGCDHGHIPNSMGVLWVLDRIAARRRLEYYCRNYQFPECRRVFVLRAQRKVRAKPGKGFGCRRRPATLRARRDLSSPRTALNWGGVAETIGVTPYNSSRYPDKSPRLDSLTDGSGRRNVRG